MINWKTCIGLSLFLISIVLVLTIKDRHYLPRMNSDLLWMEGLFLVNTFTATVLLLMGLFYKSELFRLWGKKIIKD